MDHTPAARHLERAFVFTFVSHVLAMLGLVLLLLPGVPGGLERPFRPRGRAV